MKSSFDNFDAFHSGLKWLVIYMHILFMAFMAYTFGYAVILMDDVFKPLFSFLNSVGFMCYGVSSAMMKEGWGRNTF